MVVLKVIHHIQSKRLLILILIIIINVIDLNHSPLGQLTLNIMVVYYLLRIELGSSQVLSPILIFSVQAHQSSF